MYVTEWVVTPWSPGGLAGVQSAGPAKRFLGGLQPGGSEKRFTCSHIMGGRVSAAGAACTSTGGSSVLLTGFLCAVSAPFCSCRSLFLHWHLDVCLLEDMGLGDSAVWNASRGSAGWISVSTGCRTDSGLSLVCSFPVSFLDCPPVCLSASFSPLSTLPIHQGPPMIQSWLSQKLEIRTQESLRTCRTFSISCRCCFGGG